MSRERHAHNKSSRARDGHSKVMGVGIHCLLEPEVFSANKFRTDGKNLAQGFMADAMADSEPSGGGMFDTLLPLMGGTMSGGDIAWHEPEVGLAAFAETITKLKDPAAEKLMPDADSRDGCIYDLEQFTKKLQEAETHSTSFSLVLDV